MLKLHARRNIKISSAVLLLMLFFILPIEIILAQGTVFHETVYSKALEGNYLGDSPNKLVAIYLPPEYDQNPQQSYPVIYLLHGYTQSQSTWLKYGSLNMDIKLILDDLIGQEIIQPLIVVMPNGYNKYHGSWYTNSSITGNWEDYIVVDLVEHIDSTYRTLAQRESRGIAGLSMGGTGSFKLAMKHPDVYCAVFSMSAGFISFEHSLMGPDYKPYLINAVNQTNPAMFSTLDWRERVAIAAAAAFAPNKNRLPYYGDFPVNANGALIDTNWAKWLKHDAYTMINSYQDNLLQLNGIWIDCGTFDDLYTSNKMISQELDSAGIEHTWAEFAGGHTDKTGARIEEKVLPFFSEILLDTLTGALAIDYTDSFSPKTILLMQNYPNPFNPSTRISFNLPKPFHVRLDVFNPLSQIVATLLDTKMNAGAHEVRFDASPLPSGIYFYRIQVGDAPGRTGAFSQVKKMVLIK